MYNIKTFYIYLRVIFCFVKLIFFLVNDNVDCCITDYVKRKKCHLNRTVDCYNQCICDHTKVRCPAHTGKDCYDQSCSGDRDSRAAHCRTDGKKCDCDQVCRCNVIPVGRTKLVISWEHPSSSRHVLVFSGRHAAEEFVENPNTPTFAIFLRNFIGLKPVVRPIPIG